MLLLLSGCGASIGDGEDGSSTLPPNTSTTTLGFANPPERVPNTTIPRLMGEVPDQYMAQVLEDAAERAGIDVSELEVTRSQAVEWPDGSLGCAQAGEAYIQVIIPGYWVEIDGPDDSYDYRLDDKGNFRLCERDAPVGSGLPTPPTTLGTKPSG
jgi:hypothetical protein